MTAFLASVTISLWFPFALLLCLTMGSIFSCDWSFLHLLQRKGYSDPFPSFKRGYILYLITYYVLYIIICYIYKIYYYYVVVTIEVFQHSDVCFANQVFSPILCTVSSLYSFSFFLCLSLTGLFHLAYCSRSTHAVPKGKTSFHLSPSWFTPFLTQL